MLNALQTWAADRGYGQYPLPRSRPRRARVDHIGLRLVVGTLGFFGVIVLGFAVIAMTLVIGVFVYAAFSG